MPVSEPIPPEKALKKNNRSISIVYQHRDVGIELIDFLSAPFVWLGWLFGVLLLSFVDEIVVSINLGCLPLFKRAGGGCSQDFASHVGGGPVYADDGPVVAGAWLGGSS